MSLAERFAEYVRACFTGIWIESHEHQDALAEIAGVCSAEQWRLATWDIDAGLSVAGDLSNIESVKLRIAFTTVHFQTYLNRVLNVRQCSAAIHPPQRGL